MSASTETLIKRYETSAETFEAKGKKYWAYAKNGQGDEYYGRAKAAYDKASQNRSKAELLKRAAENNGPVIKPDNFVGHTCKPVSSPGVMSAGVMALHEGAKAIVNGDSVEKATSNMVSKSMESAVNASIADVAAKAVTAVVAASNPVAATALYLTTNIVTNGIVSEVTDGSFNKIGKEVGRVTGNIEYSVSEGISEFSGNVKRVADNIGWAASNTLSDIGSGIRNFFSW